MGYNPVGSGGSNSEMNMGFASTDRINLWLINANVSCQAGKLEEWMHILDVIETEVYPYLSEEEKDELNKMHGVVRPNMMAHLKTSVLPAHPLLPKYSDDKYSESYKGLLMLDRQVRFLLLKHGLLTRVSENPESVAFR